MVFAVLNLPSRGGSGTIDRLEGNDAFLDFLPIKSDLPLDGRQTAIAAADRTDQANRCDGSPTAWAE
jgi:hypothetical protein